MKVRLVAGCMTGTSMDGLDVALVAIDGRGLGMQARYVRMGSHPLGEDVTDPLRKLADGRALAAAKIARVAHRLAQIHLDAIRTLAGDDALDLVVLHGQTVFHAPPYSWQLCNPHPVAAGLGVPVVYDLRGADLAAGGQGAPITPLADFLLLRDPGEARVIVNLGGFANFTLLPQSVAVEDVRGGDICSCNQLLDSVARELLKAPFDANGAAAARGRVKARPYTELTDVLERQAAAGRSLGSGDELGKWVTRIRKQLSAEDAARTACAAIAKVITDSTRGADRVLLAGGGTLNATLVEEIANKASAPVETTDAHGLPIAAREAACMAVLGALCQDREPITLEQITGCQGRAPIAGAWVLP